MCRRRLRLVKSLVCASKRAEAIHAEASNKCAVEDCVSKPIGRIFPSTVCVTTTPDRRRPFILRKIGYSGDMAETRDNADRFINAIEGIKVCLERKYGKEFAGFHSAIKYADERKHPVAKYNRGDLKVLGDLRNVIQHAGVLRGQVLATPRTDAVLAAEALAEQFKRATPISKVMIPNPAIVGPKDPLSKATDLVVARDFSQLPVYNEGRYQTLFTTNALARWISSAMYREDGHLIEENVTIEQVSAFAEKHEAPEFVGPNTPAYDVLDKFARDDILTTVLVTTDGKPTGKLQGLVTRFDIANILRELPSDILA